MDGIHRPLTYARAPVLRLWKSYGIGEEVESAGKHSGRAAAASSKQTVPWRDGSCDNPRHSD